MTYQEAIRSLLPDTMFEALEEYNSMEEKTKTLKEACTFASEALNESYEVKHKTRKSKDEYYLDIASAVSQRSTCLRRQYGAVIVRNDEIIATGYNGSPRGEVNCCDVGVCQREGKEHNTGDYSECHSVHAEQNAMLSASRRDMIDATMYLVGFEDGKRLLSPEPCPICKRMIKNCGIVSVVT